MLNFSQIEIGDILLHYIDAIEWTYLVLELFPQEEKILIYKAKNSERFHISTSNLKNFSDRWWHIK